MNAQDSMQDVLIIGGGPSGSTAGLALARRGLKVTILEKAAFPRFQIGESFLPANFRILENLGLLPGLQKLPHVPKLGAEFIFGYGGEGAGRKFRFNFSFQGGENRTLNIARADFDSYLLNEARAAGARVLQPCGVREISELRDGCVRLQTDAGEQSARWLIDASGQATVVGRHLGLRRPVEHPHLQKVAYFEHFEGVFRHRGDEEGFPTIVMCEEGWFWSIPLNERKTSVGLVLEPRAAREAGVPAARMLQWGIQRCPEMRDRLKNATGPQTNRVCADFSYRCEPFAGPGYFLVGDSALFLDPVFSSGVCLGMAEGVRAGELIADEIAGRRTVDSIRREYIDFVEKPTRVFRRVILDYYRHEFRELFLNGKGPVSVHRAVLEILAGHVFPQLSWAVRWRYGLFSFFMNLQKHLPLVAHRPRFSLRSATPAPAEVPPVPAAAS